MVPIEEWGKDHWSTLVYVETRCVDHNGFLRNEHMRTDIDRHPLLYGLRHNHQTTKKYPTRLRDGKELFDHDDWDCLEDMEDAGLIEIISLVNAYVKITPAGMEMAARLRQHKASGGNFAGFKPNM